jgi:DNA adenine methylase
MCQPPIKWVGGKCKVVKHILPYIDRDLKNTYIEPFLGSGSIVIELLKLGYTEVKYRCYDINPMIIEMFNMIKDKPHTLIEELRKYIDKNTREDFYRIREEYNKNPTAPVFMYLNKTCFRGLYSVSLTNKFNSGFGQNVNPKILCEENILSSHQLFNKFDITFEVSDYRDIVYENCLAYFDPPYYGSFNKYAPIRFSHEDYIHFLHTLRQNPTVKIIHSNSTTFRNVYKSEGALHPGLVAVKKLKKFIISTASIEQIQDLEE